VRPAGRHLGWFLVLFLNFNIGAPWNKNAVFPKKNSDFGTTNFPLNGDPEIWKKKSIFSPPINEIFAK